MVRLLVSLGASELRVIERCVQGEVGLTNVMY